MPVHCPRCGHSVRVKRPGWTPPDEPAPVASLPAPVADDAPAEDDDETYIYDQAGRLVLAEWTADGYLVPAVRTPSVDHAAELAARSYQLNPRVPAGCCQIIEMIPHGWDYLPPQHCPAAGDRVYGGARICGQHYLALATPLRQR